MSAKLKFTKEEVLAAYAGDASIAQAARVLGCSTTPLTKLMREYGIEGKSRGRAGRKSSAIPRLNDRAWLFEQLVTLGRTQRAVAAELGTTGGNIAHYVRHHNLYPHMPQSEAARAWFRKRYPNGRRGAEAANWKGGRSSTTSGYIRLFMPDHPHANRHGQVFEHRYVMEQKIGRLLRPGEQVDHIDLNRSNNDPENLRLHPSNSAHIKDHFNARREMMAAKRENEELKAELARLRAQVGEP